MKPYKRLHFLVLLMIISSLFTSCNMNKSGIDQEHDNQVKYREQISFLDVCDRHGIKVMFTLFDDCGNIIDPSYGKQPEVLEGWYANGWSASPGHNMVHNPETYPRLEKYVKDILSSFRDDPRVWVWDLYNEPTNSGMGDVSLQLAKKVFIWAREVGPSQPLTIAQWNSNGKLNEIIHRNSDITTFHSYGNVDRVKDIIKELKSYGRPIINTEWLARHTGSEVGSVLPVFYENNVGCMHRGLVNGKTQTHLHWGWSPERGEPDVWQHDLFLGDHTPYNEEEIELFKKYIKK